MHNRAETMIKGKFDFGFAVDLMKKDLMICLNEAVKNNSSLPITSLIAQFYTQLQQKNGGGSDTSSLIKLLQYNSRLISLEDEDRNAFVEWMIKETKNYSNWARYTSEFLNLSRQQWGRVPVEIPEAQKSQLLKEQAAIKASIKEINQQSEKLRQEIIEELLAKGL